MNKKYIVRLSEQKRQACLNVIKKLKGSGMAMTLRQKVLKEEERRKPLF